MASSSSSTESEAIDRISNLPDPLLCHILSFLTTKEAAATSTLSTKWRPLWTSVPVIDLHEEVCLEEPDPYDSSDPYDSDYSVEYRRGASGFQRVPKSGIRFSTIVNRVFDQRTTHSLKKLLLCSVLDSCNSNHVMAWVSFAVAGNVEEIELTFSRDENVELPITLFTCKTLVVLKLHEDINIVNVPSSVHLPLLKIADITGGRFAYVSLFTTFLSGCPILEELSVSSMILFPSVSVQIYHPSLKKLCIYGESCMHDVPKLEIDTPSLMFLDIYAHSILDYSVENFGNLLEARLNLSVKNGPVDPLLNMMKAIRQIRIMSLSYETIRDFDKTCNLDLPEFCNLVRLELSHYYCYKSELLVKLLKKCPKLEVLIINKESYASDEMLWIEPTCVPNCLSSHLTMFKFKEYIGYRNELGLAAYILKSAKLLKIATIQIVDSWETMKEMSNIQKQISMVPRASTTCELVFEQKSSEWDLEFE